MNLKRLAIITITTYTLCALWAFTGVQGDIDTIQTVSVPRTVTVAMLTPEQIQDRLEALTEIATTTTTTSTTTTVLQSPRIADVPAETKCQEWFPSAISVGWPNNTETLEKLGRLLWKETRCQNVSYTHPSFNGNDHGVAQINEIHTKYVEQIFNMSFAEAMSDPTLNLRFAFLLYSDIEETGGCGWKPWRLC
jgi:hypothetical protein